MSRWLAVAALGVACGLAAFLGGCSDEEQGSGAGDTANGAGGDGGGGGGGSDAGADTGGGGGGGGANPCEATPAGVGCSSAQLDEQGYGVVQVFFDEQRVEVQSGRYLGRSEATDAVIAVQASEGGYTCQTTQPGDEFSDVSCSTYNMGSYISATIGEWITLTYLDLYTNQTTEITLRVDADGDTLRLAAVWGLYECLASNANGN